MISTGEALELVRNREDTDARIIAGLAHELYEVQTRLRHQSEELTRIRGAMDRQRVQLRAVGSDGVGGERRYYALCWEGTSIQLEPLRKDAPPVISAADASLRMSM